MNVFTPRMEVNGEWVRMRMSLNYADNRKIGRGGPWQAVVTDQNTGKRYEAQGAECGLPGCMCDAIVTEIKERR